MTTFLHVINCMACYDVGEIIDPFDQARRRRCKCEAGREKAAASENKQGDDIEKTSEQD